MAKISTILIWSSTIVCINSLYTVDDSMEPVEVCGNKLANILSFICNHNYYAPKFKKSSVEDMDADSGLPSGYMSEYEKYLSLWELKDRGTNERHMVQLNFPFKARSEAFGISSNRFRRQAAGIVEECCEKPCTLTEMKGYCG